MMRALGLVVSVLGLAGFACSDATGAKTVNAGGSSSGGSSASGGSGGTIGIGGSAAASGGTAGVPDICNSGCVCDTHDGELVPLDMFVMLDRSGSMSESGKWGAITNAFNTFVSLPGIDGLGMGIGFFPPVVNPPVPEFCDPSGSCGPNGTCIPFPPPLPSICEQNDLCEPTDYAQPVVGIAPLPGVGSQITSAISSTSPSGNTPTRPALQGSLMYTLAWAAQHPDHITIVVLATDGEPVGCSPNSISDVSAEAAKGVAANPSVKTFVIGVGDLSALNAIAQAGGTGQATIVSAGNAAQEFLDALNAIRGSVGCVYNIPTPPTGTADPNKVNVGFTPDGGTQELFPNVPNAAECKGQKAWYYDKSVDPWRITLCPAACDLVTNTPGKVDVVLGCATVPA